jgi:hypothetical protein
MKIIGHLLWGFVFINCCIFAQNAPVSTIPVITSCPGESKDVPVMVNSFNAIGAVSLTLHFDAAALSYQSFTNNSGFPGLCVGNPATGVITVAGFSIDSGISLPDDAVLFTLHFTNLGGSTGLNWNDDGASCEYAGPPPSYTPLNDIPLESYFVDGSFIVNSLPSSAGIISGPNGGNVCQGQTGVAFSILPIENATAYVWYLPSGAEITSGANTNNITVTIDSSATSGIVTVYGSNECGTGEISDEFPILVNIAPTITGQPVSADTITAGAGIASFTVTSSAAGITFRWQEYATTSWSDLSNGGVYNGVFTETLTIINPPVTMDGNKYRCVVTGFCEPPAVTDGLATLSVVSVTGIGLFGHDDAGNRLALSASPNPFEGMVIRIKYSLPLDGIVSFEIVDMRDEIVATIADHDEIAGDYTKEIALNQHMSGIFAARIILKTSDNLMGNTIKIICIE